MGNEISQFDIPDRQLPAGSAQAGSWSDIGEAKITRTIFGRTKVRVIRKQDKILRAWLLGALAMTVIAVAAWQGWVALQHSKMFAVLPPLSERISVSPPVYQPETTASAAPRSPGKGRPESVIQTEIDSMLSNPNGRPPRPLPLHATQPMDATPVTAQPLIASKPQQVKPQTLPPLATNNGASTTQTTVTQSHPKTPAPAQTAAPAVATHPSTQPASPAVSTPAATHPAASKPAPVAAPAEPSSKKDAPASSAANNQTPDPANAQTQVNARGTAIIFVEPQGSAKP